MADQDNLSPEAEQAQGDAIDAITVKRMFDTLGQNIVGQQVGRMAVSFDGQSWVAGMEFGREAPDSPMYGGAAYGLGATLYEALSAAMMDAGWRF